MAKHTFCFPICTMLLALLCFSISALADNVTLASAQPEFAGSTNAPASRLYGNSELFSLNPSTAGANGVGLTPLEMSWLNRQGGDYPRFGKSKGKGDPDWKKHPKTVPEPSSLTLLGTSVLAIAFGFRRRFQR
jgi:PEP-CTERM motif